MAYKLNSGTVDSELTEDEINIFRECFFSNVGDGLLSAQKLRSMISALNPPMQVSDKAMRVCINNFIRRRLL